MTSNIDNVLIDDIENNLLFFKNGKIANRGMYINDNHLDYFGEYKKTIKDTIDIVEYKGRNKLGFIINNKAYFTKDGFLKLGLMDKHISDKKVFEDKLIKHLNLNNKKCIIITLNNGQYDLDVFFLKYISKEVLSSIYWYINRNKPLNIVITLLDNEIIYHATNYYNIDDCIVLYYIIGDFLKAYETMGLELAPVIEEIKPLEFPQSADDARCTMMDEIKNLDAETLYPKTITIGNLSIHDDKIIEAYNQFLNIIFDIEKYDGISIRVPKECTEDWFKILPCFKYVRNLAYKITPYLDLYVSIKKLGINGNYLYDVSGTDYITNNINNNRCMFSDYDKILNLNISDLQTRLLDIIQDNTPPIVNSGDEIKLGNEIKDIDSKTSKSEANDITMPTGQVMNNLLRGLPFNHIDNYDLTGDTIIYELNIKNKLSGLKELNPTDLSDWVNNNSSNFDKNFKHINLGGVDSAFSATSLLKRLPIVSKYGVNDVVSDSEIKTLNGLYNNYIVSSDNLTFDYVNKLNEKYNHIFKHHIEIGILYPKLNFNYEYGYYLNNNCTIEYGVVRSNVVPFEYMVSTRPINMYKDIEYKYNIFVSTQSNLCHAQNSIDGVQLLDIYQADKCKGIYRTIFSKYIELGVLKDTLELITVRPDKYYKFSAVDDIYK